MTTAATDTSLAPGRPHRMILALAVWSAVALLATLIAVFQNTPLLNQGPLSTRVTLSPARMTHRDGYSYVHPGWWFGWGDSVGERRSSILLYEDDAALPLPHALHDDIEQLGGGRWSHWTRSIIFSPSDGSDPRTNGRRYSVQALTLPVRAGSIVVALVAAIAALRTFLKILKSPKVERPADEVPGDPISAVNAAAPALAASAAGEVPRRSAPSRKVLALASMAVSVLMVVVILVILEGWLRLNAAPPADAQLRLATGTGWARSDAPYRRIDSAPKDGTAPMRVLFMGDSYTHARTWGDKVIAQLRESGVPAVGFEAGVSGFGTTQALLLLRDLIPELKPDAVVFQFYGWNDMRDNWRYPGITYNPRMTLRPFMDEDGSIRAPGAWRIAVKELELWKQLVEPWLEQSRASRAERLVATEGIDALAARRAAILVPFSEPASWLPFYTPSMQEGPYVSGAWRVTDRALRELRDLCAAHQVPLMVIGIDGPFTVDDEAVQRCISGRLSTGDDWDFDLPMKRLAQSLNAIGVPFEDMVPRLRERRNRMGGAAQYDGPDTGAHLTPGAEVVFADAVSPWLISIDQRRLDADAPDHARRR
ncbi:MAG: SGNH/GDSL hydrolase family protein [Phycisphaeraceae bacterium]|nr:SGNH/GDSL hydrolase family protein [Phycisphaeraceae bacterium]